MLPFLDKAASLLAQLLMYHAFAAIARTACGSDLILEFTKVQGINRIWKKPVLRTKAERWAFLKVTPLCRSANLFWLVYQECNAGRVLSACVQWRSTPLPFLSQGQNTWCPAAFGLCLPFRCDPRPDQCAQQQTLKNHRRHPAIPMLGEAPHMRSWEDTHANLQDQQQRGQSSWLRRDCKGYFVPKGGEPATCHRHSLWLYTDQINRQMGWSKVAGGSALCPANTCTGTLIRGLCQQLECIFYDCCHYTACVSGSWCVAFITKLHLVWNVWLWDPWALHQLCCLTCPYQEPRPFQFCCHFR